MVEFICLKLDILSKGGKIYYTDTDSIVTDTELDTKQVNENEIGKLKLEQNINKGIFISGKLYWICNDKGEFIIRAKGVKSKSLSYSDFVNLYKDNNINTAIKRQSKIDWAAGDVKITDKNITISSSAYTKRTKLYRDGRWVDTRPKVINTVDTSIVVWKPKDYSLIVYYSINQTFFTDKSEKILGISQPVLMTVHTDSTGMEKSQVNLEVTNTHVHTDSTGMKKSHVKLQDTNTHLNYEFKWWYWCIIPLSIIGYYMSLILSEGEEDLSNAYDVKDISYEEHTNIENNITELNDLLNSKIELPPDDVLNEEWPRRPISIEGVSIRVENTIALESGLNKGGKSWSFIYLLLT